jgi:hypothetical protein
MAQNPPGKNVRSNGLAREGERLYNDTVKTLTVTEGRRRLGYWCEKAIKGEDIAFTINGQLVALRAVRVYSEDYALQEYGATPDQVKKATDRIKAEIADDDEQGLTVEFDGKVPV